jgi:hypothetical protein
MSNPDRSVSAATKKNHNRVAAIMVHTSRYSCFPTSRLAADSGIAKSTISHLIHGRSNPLYSTVVRVVNCLEKQLRSKFDTREVFSDDGTYPTHSICELCNCTGCLPETVFLPDSSRKLEHAASIPGRWSGDTLENQDVKTGETR